MNKSKKNNKSSIIYVNFAPYENAGNILDYIRDRFRTVIVYSFNFHTLSANQKPSRLTVYRNGKQIYWTKLFQTPTKSDLAFIFLPIRSLIFFLQLIYHTIRLRKRFGKPDLFFTVNAFTAWCGYLMRDLGLVGKTIFWIWDYYPPMHESKVVMFMRWLYWQFDKPATQHADHIAFLNRHLKELRVDLGILPSESKFPIIPIGTNPAAHISPKLKNPIRLVFLGVLKKIQGLDLVIDAIPILKKQKKMFEVHIIGGGPDEAYFRGRTSKVGIPIIFHGYVSDDQKVDDIIKSCHIGLAPYVPDRSNVMYYSDPSKIKRYLNFGLPVVTTDVFDFSKDIESAHAGKIISYDTESFSRGIEDILSEYKKYAQNSLQLAKTISYKKLYGGLFSITLK